MSELTKAELQAENAALRDALAERTAKAEALKARLAELEASPAGSVRAALAAHLAAAESATPDADAELALQHIASFAQYSNQLPDAITRALMALRTVSP